MDDDGNTQSERTTNARLTEKDITGLKYFDQIAPLLKRLHDDASDRDTAGNRILHYDQYCMLMLLYFFNPIVFTSQIEATQSFCCSKKLCGRQVPCTRVQKLLLFALNLSSDCVFNRSIAAMKSGVTVRMFLSSIVNFVTGTRFLLIEMPVRMLLATISVL